MRTYRTAERTVIDEFEIGRTCDICGKEIEQKPYREDVCTISCSEGDNYGSEGADYVTTEFDVCVECFKSKLTPFINGHLGAVPSVCERSW